MLLSFELTNFGSFKEAAFLDFTRRSFKTLQPKDGNWIDATQPAVGIWGANASGKSTVLRALISLARVLWLPIGANRTLSGLNDPHRLSEVDESTFVLEFESCGVRFRWSICISSKGITSEKFDASDKSKWKKLIRREGSEISFGPSSRIPQEARSFIRQASTEQVSSVQAWVHSKDGGPYVHGPQYLRKHVRILHPTGIYPRETSRFVENLLKDEQWRKAAVQLLQYADLGISDLNLEKKEEILSKEVLDFFAAFMRAQDGDGSETPISEMEVEISLLHGTEAKGFTLPLSNESDGTRTWLETALPALFTVVHGDVLIIDEIDDSLHPHLVRRLIGLFTDKELNGQGAQLLFTTHDSTLLGKYPTPAIEKEASWFTEKQQHESFLYSLDEFDVRESNNPEKQYLMGKYGAVPEQENLYLESELFSSQNELASQVGE